MKALSEESVNMSISLLAPFVLAIPILWLGWIRPYCILHRRGYTAGANPGITMWVDWQHAGEVARENGDSRMKMICRVFLGLHLFLAAAFVMAIALFFLSVD